MANTILDQLRDNYDDQYGVVNVRPVVDELVRTSRDPLAEVSATFESAELRWRIPILEAMRVLAAMGFWTEGGAKAILKATDAVAAESGKDEYYKSINALVVSSQQATKELMTFVSDWLRGNHFERWLACYTIGMLIEHRKEPLPEELRSALRSAAMNEESLQMRPKFRELLTRNDSKLSTRA